MLYLDGRLSQLSREGRAGCLGDRCNFLPHPWAVGPRNTKATRAKLKQILVVNARFGTLASTAARCQGREGSPPRHFKCGQLDGAPIWYPATDIPALWIRLGAVLYSILRMEP